MTAELRDLQQRLEKEFRKKNNEACEEHSRKVEATRNAKWPTMTTEQKIAEDDRRFLNEAFKDGELAEPLTIKFIDMPILFLDIVRRTGKKYEYYNYPAGHQEREGKYKIIVAVVRETSNNEALAKWQKISGQVKDLSRQEKQKEQEVARKNEERVLAASGKGSNWVVTGMYKIKCPIIEDGWGEQEDLRLTLFAEKGQLFAKFNFGIIEGYMRLERQAKDPNRSIGQPAKKRKRLEVEHEDTAYDPYDSDRRSPTPEEFYLGKITMPSQENPIWNYRWRGTDVGCGEKQIDSEKKLYRISFLEPLGTNIEGTFGSEYHKDCAFTGHKIATGKTCDGNLSEAWSELSENGIYY
ncbi:hypothetical protein BKA64DRAFT_226567 [Cadophora sp. MPI-SDFR-AT-0126]|nr:hypothetical protein BKA64DRAFT_226567 [Leotiomycetes sp. MPI-SDFR-AT-0126]